jgi:inward rectifier potassium channel
MAKSVSMTAPNPPQVHQPRLFASAKQRRRLIRVLNARPAGMSDAYHWLLRSSWTLVLVCLTVSFLMLNFGFAFAFWLTGGVTNAVDFLACFFFSIQTFATIGYGAMYPASDAAHLVVTVESVVSVIFNAVVTGLAFAKFSRPTARVIWSQIAVVCDRDGIPTLMFRVANERINHVVEASLRCAVIRNEVTLEGEQIRKIIDLQLVRNTSPSFLLTWTAMHQIVPGSPLYGVTLEQFSEARGELVVTLTGLDETLGQTIHARTSYLASDIKMGARFVDILGPPDQAGRRTIDYGKFDDSTDAPVTRSKLGLFNG